MTHGPVPVCGWWVGDRCCIWQEESLYSHCAQLLALTGNSVLEYVLLSCLFKLDFVADYFSNTVINLFEQLPVFKIFFCFQTMFSIIKQLAVVRSHTDSSNRVRLRSSFLVGLSSFHHILPYWHVYETGSWVLVIFMGVITTW